MANLMLHAGSKVIGREELFRVDAPAATGTWFPVPHREVLTVAESLLQSAGFALSGSRYGLSPDGHRFFGVLDIRLPMAHSDGITLAVGIRNSTDKTFPIGMAAGSRVFVCDNLAFSAELVVTRKHTRHGMTRWTEGIGAAVGKLDGFRKAETRRIELMQGLTLDPTAADSLILRAFSSGIVGSRQLPIVVAEWDSPSFDWGTRGTAWHLYNAMTFALNPTATTNPHRHAGITMKLMRHFAGALGSDGAALMEGPDALPTLRDDGEGEDNATDLDHLKAGDAEILIPQAAGMGPDGWDLID